MDDSSEYRKAENNGEQRRVDLLIEKMKKVLEWLIPRKVKNILEICQRFFQNSKTFVYKNE